MVTGFFQRYVYNSKFYNPSKGLVFLMIGGEGSISPPGDKWIRDESITMMQWAKDFGAAAFLLEHRFYGPRENSPTGKQDTESLKLLSIDQALEDIKEFIDQMNAKYFPKTKTHWVTFGGSYPESLSAFFRETYPEYSIGAMSSSSAVEVFVDYYGYLVHTEENYRAENNKCAENIRTAFTIMQKLAYSGKDGRERLRNIFNLCQSFDETNVVKSLQFFYSNVIGYFQAINQYSGDNRDEATRNGMGIPMACQIMNNSTDVDEMVRVKKIMDWYVTMYGAKPGCYPNSYKNYVDYYRDTSYNNKLLDDVGNFYSDQCIDLFGPEYTLTSTYERVAKVLKKYGGANAYRGTKAAFTNGSIDPWKSLGLLKGNPANKVDAFLIEGTAHCAEMYPASPKDRKSLTDARVRLKAQLSDWIKDAATRSGNTATLGFITSILVLLSSVHLRI
ncbi:serine carboxypeptidase S28 [Necator americanus]|uniref:Serine carboxypeptidase S28 n=1 Tax=Necator americanus TaxID=51031 RepID=W2TJQ0_NECAM|nr:serine carboxypeptidase S28 [Necator americanus]ETN81237.1 serine carboxypeptidase S28 [Necator americanus]